MALYTSDCPVSPSNKQCTTQSSCHSTSRTSEEQPVNHQQNSLLLDEAKADLQPVQSSNQTAVSSGEDADLQSLGGPLVAIAGHDPAILEVWDLQVTRPAVVKSCVQLCQ